jgi:hypothetical protein
MLPGKPGIARLRCGAGGTMNPLGFEEHPKAGSGQVHDPKAILNGATRRVIHVFEDLLRGK